MKSLRSKAPRRPALAAPPAGAGPAPNAADPETTLNEQEVHRLLEVTSAVFGHDFFDAVTRGLAHALDVPIAFASELADPEGRRLRLVSLWWHDRHGASFEYPIAGTPCEHVVGRRLACFPEGAAALFPDDAWLAEHDIEAYLAVPFFDAEGRPAGHLGVMDHRPFERPGAKIAALQVIARRANAELDRVHAERELERYRRHLEALVGERTLALRRSLGDLRSYGYIASHQLRAPVITIANLAGLLRGELTEADSEASDLAGRIERAAGRLEEMIDGMEVYCALEGRDPLSRAAVPMAEAARVAVVRLGARLAAVAGEVVVADVGMPRLRVDRGAFEVLFGALVRNAIDHADGRRPRVHVSAERADGWRFSVRDEGPGIPPDRLAGLQALLAGEATADDESGVGLPLARRIVEAHGGHLRLESAPGAGTTVVFTLPLALEDA